MSDQRFQFGRNWQNFSRTLNEEKIRSAIGSLQAMLGKESLEGCSFLDAGCGSGLFSLAACRLGADFVVSFDYDMDSVRCTEAIHVQFGKQCNWRVFPGDVLQRDWMAGLGQFDIVYSWGVLHHTGRMWDALDTIALTVKEGGFLYIGIYNNQGRLSQLWTIIKRIYNHSLGFVRWLMASGWFVMVVITRMVRGFIARRALSEWFKGSERGMNLWHDAVDWMGGYPFETAKPDELISFFAERGFEVTAKKLKPGSGCNELVLRKIRKPL